VIDIRPAAQRRRRSEIPGALIVERVHLDGGSTGERCAAAAGHRLRRPGDRSAPEGYTSSLSAAALQDLGLGRAHGPWIGGFKAWQAVGLPVSGPYARHRHVTPALGWSPRALLKHAPEQLPAGRGQIVPAELGQHVVEPHPVRLVDGRSGTNSA